MAKIYKQYSITGTSFPETFYQLQSDAEFHLAKEDPDGDEILPYLIEVNAGKSTCIMAMTEDDHINHRHPVQEILYWMTLLVFESDIDKIVYMKEKRICDDIRRSKIKIDFNPLVRPSKK